MKRILLFQLIKASAILIVYMTLLHLLAGTNVISAIFCPGPHLPHYYPVVISLFLFLRIIVVLLPGLFLSRLALGWITKRMNDRHSARNFKKGQA